ncbi:hypothetical protein Tco_1099942 [Tanacetum coccineum]
MCMCYTSSRVVGSSSLGSPRWSKANILEAKGRKLVCGFRLWASWMSSENSFRIKSFHSDHKCSRNYRLGSLVAYKWVAHQYAKEIINDSFISYRVMNDAIRRKFIIDAVTAKWCMHLNKELDEGGRARGGGRSTRDGVTCGSNGGRGASSGGTGGSSRGRGNLSGDRGRSNGAIGRRGGKHRTGKRGESNTS